MVNSSMASTPATLKPIEADEAPHHSLEPLFRPASVVVVGASDRADSIGRAVLANLVAGGFAGPIDAVNPKHDTVQGRPCHARIRDLDRTPALALIAVPAKAVPGVLRDLGRKGTRHAIVLTAGFAEAGPAGRKAQAAMQAAAAKAGIRLVGPNCLGIARPANRFNATFAPSRLLPGSLAVITQSTAIGSALLDFAEGNGIGLSAMVATGSAIDVDIGDMLDFLTYDGSTRSIAMYLEGLRRPREFLSALRAVARIKPVVVLKGGRAAAGSSAALRHNDTPVGDDDAFRAALRRCGAVTVENFAELFNAVEWLATGHRISGERLTIVTNGGGLGVLAADACANYRVRIAELGEPSKTALDAILPPSWSRANPIDLVGDATPARIATAMQIVGDDEATECVLAMFCPTQVADSAAIANALLEHKRRAPTLYCFVGEADARHGRAVLNKAHRAVFTSPETAVRAFSMLTEYERGQRQLRQAPAREARTDSIDEAAVSSILADAAASGARLLGEVDAKRLLAACGVPVPRTTVAADADGAATLAASIGYPVALKIVSPDIVDKSTIGGVRLDIRDEAELRGAAGAILQRVAAARPQARIAGLSVQPMISRRHAIELLVAATTDPVFGPVISFGAGGIALEVAPDTACALPPLNTLLAQDLIERTRIAGSLAGNRDVPPARLDSIVDVLLAVSALVCRFPAIRSLDIDPLIADADGVTALDARIVIDPARLDRDDRYSHLAIHPYPQELESVVTLPGGQRMLLRPIRPDDAKLQVAFFESLSDTTRHWRFLHPIKALSEDMIARFTQVDYGRDMALVAIPLDEPEPRFVGIARYVREIDASRAEFAVVVGDDWQGTGLAGRMMRHLSAHARHVGLRALVGYIHSQNRRMLSFMRRQGFTLKRSREEPTMTLATLALDREDATGEPG